MNSQGRTNATLKALNDSVQQVLSIVVAIQDQVNIIQPRCHLHKISKPKNYQKTYGRDPNVAAMFRKLVQGENSQLSTNAARTFLNFPEHCKDEEVNEDAKRTAYGYMCLLLPSGWEGKKSWSEICKVWKRESERVIQALSSRDEFRVFAQGGGDWGIRMVVEQKMKSVASSARKRPLENFGREGKSQKAMKKATKVNISSSSQERESAIRTGQPLLQDFRQHNHLPSSPHCSGSDLASTETKKTKDVRIDRDQNIAYPPSESTEIPATSPVLRSRGTSASNHDGDEITTASPESPATRNIFSKEQRLGQEKKPAVAHKPRKTNGMRVMTTSPISPSIGTPSPQIAGHQLQVLMQSPEFLQTLLAQTALLHAGTRGSPTTVPSLPFPPAGRIQTSTQAAINVETVCAEGRHGAQNEISTTKGPARSKPPTTRTRSGTAIAKKGKKRGAKK